CLAETAASTAMIFMILLGADFFNAFLGLSRMPMDLAQVIGESGLAPMAVLLLMLLAYLLLGCVMDSLAMILLTVPVFWPIIAVLDFGLAEDDLKMWFGIIVLVVVEVGLITPPVGLNAFVINSMARGVKLKETFLGILPFLASDFIRVALLVLFPALTLWLPHLFK
ncbi:MAG TPA: TRAP transporter large permease subunit, partial [Magnetovibrio sp.]